MSESLALESVLSGILKRSSSWGQGGGRGGVQAAAPLAAPPHDFVKHCDACARNKSKVYQLD